MEEADRQVPMINVMKRYSDGLDDSLPIIQKCFDLCTNNLHQLLVSITIHMYTVHYMMLYSYVKYRFRYTFHLE